MRPIAFLLPALALLAPGAAVGPTHAQRYVPVVRPVPCCVTHVGPGLNPAQLTPPIAYRPAELPMSLRAENFQGAPLYSLDPAAHPETRIAAPGAAASIGREIAVGDRRIVVKDADAALVSRALEYLGQVLAPPLTAVALLHPEQDAALLGRLRQAWGEADFVNPPPGEATIAELFAAHRNRRLVLFGYLGGPVGASDGSDAQDNYAVFNPLGNPTTVPLSRVRQLARDNEVEALLVGTGWYGAGAGAASLGGLGQDELAAMLATMRTARTRTELLAAVATPERPVLVDPARLVAELEQGAVSVRRMGEERASAISLARVLVPAPPPPPPDEPPPDGGGEEEENEQQPIAPEPERVSGPSWWEGPLALAVVALLAFLGFRSWRAGD
jgi:hypothetical protein